MSASLEARGVSVRFGNKLALENVDLSAAPGTINCIFGPDGSGKTTLLRAIAGTLKLESGSIKVDPNLGYLAEGARVYADLSVEANVSFFYDIHGGDLKNRSSEIDSILDFTGLSEKKPVLAGNLSGGQRQRLSLANVLANRPGLLLLDEPTTGLDPVARRELWRSFGQLKSQGVTVVIATPYMDEVELSDHAVVLAGGKLVAAGAPRQLLSEYSGRVIEVTASQRLGRDQRRRLEAAKDISKVYVLGDRVRCLIAGSPAEALAEVRALFPQASVIAAEPKLEDVLIDLFQAVPV